MKKAIPTSYRGVAFDSKSEAVFARYMDLREIKWHVEHPIRHDGHDWDFLVWIDSVTSVQLGDKGVEPKWYGTWGKAAALVELKPEKPTDVYLDNLRRQDRGDEVGRFCVWGSPWSLPTTHENWGNHIYSGIDLRDDTKRIVQPIHFLFMDDKFPLYDESMITQQAKEYRFDLDNG